jgi:hypothetical protein
MKSSAQNDTGNADPTTRSQGASAITPMRDRQALDAR